METRGKLDWVAMIAWAMASVAIVSGFASPVGLGATFLGGILGAIGGDHAPALGSRKARVIVFLILVALVVVLPAFVQLLPLPVLPGLLADEICDLGPKALVGTFLVRTLSRKYAWFRAVEVALIGIAIAQWLAAHRMGNTHRPYWLMDRWIEWGRTPELLLWLVGAGAVLLMTAMLLKRPVKRASVVLAVCIAVLLLMATCFLPSLPYMPPSPPLPPRSHTPDPPQPPPPNPNPIALVQLKTNYRPPERIGAYYFREKVMSHLDGMSLVEDTGTNTCPEAWTAFPVRPVIPEKEAVLTNRGMVVSEVSLLVDTNRPFSLVNGISIDLLPKPNPPFKRSYRCVSAGLGSSGNPDLDLGTFRQVLVSANWTPAQSNLYLSMPADSNLQALANQIIGQLPEMLSEYLPPRVKVIRTWMNTNLSFSSKAGVEAECLPLTNFVFSTRTGGSRQFAMTAALLFRCAGVPARLASGYVVASGKDDDKSQFVISDSHAQMWPEVFVENTGWVPVPLNPTNVIDRPNPPPDPEIEKTLEKKVEEKPPSAFQLPTESHYISWGMGLVVVLLAGWFGAGVYSRFIRVLMADDSSRHKKALASGLSIARAAGFARQYGQTYFQFAADIQKADRSKDKVFSSALNKLFAMYRDSYETGKVYSAKEWAKCLFVMSVSVLLTYSCRTWWPFVHVEDKE